MRCLPTIVAVAIVAGVVAAPGCGRSAKYVRPYPCEAVESTDEARVQAVWNCNRDVMVRAERGKKFSLREFRGAAAFFEGLTGIAADARDSRQGPIPGPRLGENLDAWDGWYDRNRDRLTWDPRTGSVRLSGDGRD